MDLPKSLKTGVRVRFHILHELIFGQTEHGKKTKVKHHLKIHFQIHDLAIPFNLLCVELPSSKSNLLDMDALLISSVGYCQC